MLGPVQQQLDRRYGLAFAPSGSAVRYVLFLNHPPLGARDRPDADPPEALPGLIGRAGLRDAAAMVAGDTALSGETLNATISDLERVIPAVLVVIFIVIAIFLRAVVAPLYLVLTGALATVAALGLTVYVMQTLLGYGQLIWYLVAVVAVLLISLGSDYNIFSVGYIWEEARRRPLRQALAVAVPRSTRAINAAGITLAASFALVALIPVAPFEELAFAVAVGVLVDAFIVRSLLVPALVSLVGRTSGWPGRRLVPPPGAPDSHDR